MPQFCIDNEIKKPLFILPTANNWQFFWELYVQLKYDKRITPQFSLINGNIENINFSLAGILGGLEIKNIKEIDFKTVDMIILLTTNKHYVIKGKKSIYLDELTNYFVSQAYAEIPLLHFIQKNPGVKLILTNFPQTPVKYEGGLEFQLHEVYSLDQMTALMKKLEKDDTGNLPTPLDELGYSNREVYKMAMEHYGKTNPDGSTSLKDDIEPPVCIKNGKRMTAYQPEHYKNKIYFFGSCHHFGLNAPYDKTIESYLQKMLNDANYAYRVENEAQQVCNRCQDVFYNLNNIKITPGDIVFIWLENLRAKSIPFFDIWDAFAPPVDYKKVYAFSCHFNERGYKILAEKFFNLLIKYDFFQNIDFNYPAPPPPPHRYGIPKENFFGNSNFINNKDLESYKEKLRSKRLKIGAIVMNCNPFTLGHKTLIEYAAARVQKLYIFVVEEDKSEFKFADRLRLVEMGVEEFPNVEVIPSGKFIISQQTFAGYFNKAELQDVAVDSSEDVEIFAREIAPTLGINIRFAGAEPEDTVTRQYNENMKNILPHYGIDFCEIPRREIDGEVISAKSVRAALKIGDFEKISKLVPITTLEFLRKNYAHSSPPPLLVDEN